MDAGYHHRANSTARLLRTLLHETEESSCCFRTRAGCSRRVVRKNSRGAMCDQASNGMGRRLPDAGPHS
jgi:hypothetical protein